MKKLLSLDGRPVTRTIFTLDPALEHPPCDKCAEPARFILQYSTLGSGIIRHWYRCRTHV